MDPTISVIMPVYNGLPFVREAVESLCRQTLRDIEILVLDDGSTDGTAEYLQSVNDPRVKVERLPKQGYVPLLNRGLQQAQGRFIARMDADDVSLPERLELQLQYLEQNPDVAVVGCQALEIDETGQELGPREYPTSPTQIWYRLTTRVPLLHPGVLVRREAVEAAGRYEVGYTTAEDYDYWWRLAEWGRIANLDQVLVRYRIHSKSVTFSQTQRQSEIAQEICIRHLTERELAQTREEARDYYLCQRRLYAVQEEYTAAQWKNFLTVFERVATWARQHCPDAAEELPKIRQQIRWAFTARGSQAGLTLGTRMRWLQRARQVDPSQMSIGGILKRIGERALAGKSIGL